jgi:type VI secretion system secreted protein VgrG
VLEIRTEKDHKITVNNIETRDIGERYQDGGYSRQTTLKQGDDKLDVQNGKIDVEALTEINLKVGDSTIKMTPGSIEIKSPTITIHSQALTEVKSDGQVVVQAPGVMIN